MLVATLGGDTLKYTWLSAGAVVTAHTYEVLDGTETQVSSGVLSDDGGGSWSVNFTVPTTLGYYVIKSTATIDGMPYIRATTFEVISMEVD